MTTAAGREVVTAAERLMDGLLDAEHECFTHLDAGLRRTADATRERIVAAGRLSEAQLRTAALLPNDDWLGDVLLPPVSDLVALARERALRVVGRQMRLCATTLGDTIDTRTVARRAEAHARAQATEVERVVFANAGEAMVAAAATTRARIIEQRDTWQARHEPVNALIARCCSADRVGLPGVGIGAVWRLRASMHATARSASVDTANALLLAGMKGWNDTIDAGTR